MTQPKVDRKRVEKMNVTFRVILRNVQACYIDRTLKKMPTIKRLSIYKQTMFLELYAT